MASLPYEVYLYELFFQYILLLTLTALFQKSNLLS